MSYGHHPLPTNGTRDAPPVGDDRRSVVLIAAEPRNRGIPLRKQLDAPAGQDRNECYTAARRARDATLRDDDVTPGDGPGAAALPSTAHPRIVAPPAELLYEYMWEESI